jgi:hypothetical protein
MVDPGGGAGVLPVGRPTEGAGAADTAGRRHYRAVRDSLRQVLGAIIYLFPYRKEHTVGGEEHRGLSQFISENI